MEKHLNIAMFLCVLYSMYGFTMATCFEKTGHHMDEDKMQSACEELFLWMSLLCLVWFPFTMFLFMGLGAIGGEDDEGWILIRLESFF